MASLTNTIILKALDGLSERAAVTAENIANANTPNYSPRRVSFEAALADAAKLGAGAVAAVKPTIGPEPLGPLDTSMRLDLEVANATGTSLRYQALVEILNRRMHLSQSLWEGGR